MLNRKEIPIKVSSSPTSYVSYSILMFIIDYFYRNYRLDY